MPLRTCPDCGFVTTRVTTCQQCGHRPRELNVQALIVGIGLAGLLLVIRYALLDH